MMQTMLNALRDEILTWEGVTSQSHRFGGTEFNLGKIEIGHMHQNGLVDIPFTRKIREALVATDAAEPHHILPETGWISYYMRHENDLANAVALMRLSYLHKRSRRAGAEMASQIANLPFDNAVKQAATGSKHDSDGD